MSSEAVFNEHRESLKLAWDSFLNARCERWSVPQIATACAKTERRDAHSFLLAFCEILNHLPEEAWTLMGKAGDRYGPICALLQNPRLVKLRKKGLSLACSDPLSGFASLMGARQKSLQREAAVSVWVNQEREFQREARQIDPVAGSPPCSKKRKWMQVFEDQELQQDVAIHDAVRECLDVLAQRFALLIDRSSAISLFVWFSKWDGCLGALQQLTKAKDELGQHCYAIRKEVFDRVTQVQPFPGWHIFVPCLHGSQTPFEFLERLSLKFRLMKTKLRRNGGRMLQVLCWLSWVERRLGIPFSKSSRFVSLLQRIRNGWQLSEQQGCLGQQVVLGRGLHLTRLRRHTNESGGEPEPAAQIQQQDREWGAEVGKALAAAEGFLVLHEEATDLKSVATANELLTALEEKQTVLLVGSTTKEQYVQDLEKDSKMAELVCEGDNWHCAIWWLCDIWTLTDMVRWQPIRQQAADLEITTLSPDLIHSLFIF